MDPLGVHDPERVGPYRLLGRLGAGGMGQVFLGGDQRGELVAVKVVHPGFAHDERFRLRFRREVEISRQVTGPWVAAVVDADPDASTPWLATQYVRGPSLGAAVQARGPLPTGAVHALAHGLAIALAAVHAAGLVHRDLKPSNVLLGADHPRLIDFGISRAVDATQVTSTGVIVGTPAFMSPEQIGGEEVGPASDVFSLGSVLAFAATGRSPFGDHQPLPLMMRISGHEPDLDGVPDVLRGPISACLAKRPEGRPTAAELGGMLGTAVAGGPGWLPAEVAALGPGPELTAPPAATKVADGIDVAEAVRVARAPVEEVRPISRRGLLAALGAVGVVSAGAIALADAYGLGESRWWSPAPSTADAPEPRPRWRAAVPYWAGSMFVAADDSTVYVYSGEDTAFVIALDRATGLERWRVPGWTPDVKSYYSANLVPANDRLVVGTDTVVAALDSGTGRRLWEVPRTAFFHEAIGVTSNVVVAATDAGLAGLDLMSGERIWGGDPVQPRATIAAGRDTCFSSNDAQIEARDPRTGRLLWSYDTGVSDIPALAVADDVLVAGAGQSVVALDLETGQPRWNTTQALHAETPHGLWVVGGVVVAQVEEGDAVHGLDLRTGTQLWTLPESGQTNRGTLLAADDLVYVNLANGPTCAYDARTGTRRWAFREGPTTYWVPVAAYGSDAYLFTVTGHIQAVSMP